MIASSKQPPAGHSKYFLKVNMKSYYNNFAWQSFKFISFLIFQKKRGWEGGGCVGCGGNSGGVNLSLLPRPNGLTFQDTRLSRIKKQNRC